MERKTKINEKDDGTTRWSSGNPVFSGASPDTERARRKIFYFLNWETAIQEMNAFVRVTTPVQHVRVAIGAMYAVIFYEKSFC